MIAPLDFRPCRTGRDTITPEERRMINDFIARDGVKICPPMTYSDPEAILPKYSLAADVIRRQKRAETATQHIREMLLGGASVEETARALRINERSLRERMNRRGWNVTGILRQRERRAG